MEQNNIISDATIIAFCRALIEHTLDSSIILKWSELNNEKIRIARDIQIYNDAYKWNDTRPNCFANNSGIKGCPFFNANKCLGDIHLVQKAEYCFIEHKNDLLTTKSELEQKLQNLTQQENELLTSALKTLSARESK